MSDLKLPDDWSARRLGDVLRLQNGYAFKPAQWSTTGVPIIRIQNLNSRSAAFNCFAGELPEKFRARSGDLLFAWSGTPGTSFGAHVWSGGDAWINQHIFRVDFSTEDYDRDFLRLALNANLNAYISEAQGGVGLAHITKAKLNESLLVTPPLEVQRQIAMFVAIFGEKARSSSSRLDNARRAIANFRRAVLSAACSGKLTADWRERHHQPEWRFDRAEDVCSKVQSGSTPREWHEGDDGIPFLKVYNIVNQELDFAYRPQFISRELFSSRFARTEARPGDVLMNIVGPPLGKVAKVTDEYPVWSINQALTLFRPSEKVSTDWLYIFLCSGISVAAVMNETRGTVGQVNISLTQCRNFEIPLPSLEEQAEISRRVSQLLKLTEVVERRVDAARQKAEATSGAVLAKAFRGGLPLEAVSNA